MINNKLSKLDQKSKLYLFSNLKQSYLSISNFEYRKLITKLRISEPNLLIENGRHLIIPREQRLCSHCKCINDEKHFILHCTINSELRSSFLNILNNENQIFNNFSESEKLSYILNPSTPRYDNVTLSSLLLQRGLRFSPIQRNGTAPGVIHTGRLVVLISLKWLEKLTGKKDKYI